MKENNTEDATRQALLQGAVSHRMMEKDFYCRQRNCIHHHGFKNENVLCDVAKPEIFTDEKERVCCKSFCG